MNELADKIENLNNDKDFIRRIDVKEREEREYKARLNAATENGIKQGEDKKTLEIAKKLKSMNLPISQIEEATGLSKEEIEKI